MLSRNIEDHLKFSECFPLPLQRCCQVDWVLQEIIRKKLKKGIEPFFFFKSFNYGSFAWISTTI